MNINEKINRIQDKIVEMEKKVQYENLRSRLSELRKERWLKTPMFADLDDISLKEVIGKGFAKL